MIFLSYNNGDRDLVHPIAHKIGEKYGFDKVFFQPWSIKPGDGIIDRMNTGLEQFQHFFLFASRNSLASPMVALEWHNALALATKGQGRFVPIRLDNVPMPGILTQTAYIDAFSHGVDEAVRQMNEAIDGSPATPIAPPPFENVIANVTIQSASRVRVSFKAKRLSEASIRFAVITPHPKENLRAISKTDAGWGSVDTMISIGGKDYPAAIFHRITGAISPGYPFDMEIWTADDFALGIVMIMRSISQGEFTSIPLSISPSEMKLYPDAFSKDTNFNKL